MEAELAYCDTLMCNESINNQEDARMWLLANDPDRNPNVDIDLFTKVRDCYKQRKFCRRGSTRGSAPSTPGSTRGSTSSTPRGSAPSTPGEEGSVQRVLPLKARSKVYTCMRHTENWSKILPQHKLDNTSFDPE
jgi:hypothetical protein